MRARACVRFEKPFSHDFGQTESALANVCGRVRACVRGLCVFSRCAISTEIELVAFCAARVCTAPDDDGAGMCQTASAIFLDHVARGAEKLLQIPIEFETKRGFCSH